MTQVLDQFLHVDGIEYVYIVNEDGDFAVITKAEYIAMTPADNALECTCTPLSDACPACKNYIRQTIGANIPF